MLLSGVSSSASAQGIGSYDISNFNNFQALYNATFNAIDNGAYGLFGEAFAKKGYGVAFGIETNMGIVDIEYSSVAFNLGPTYGIALNDKFALSCPLMLTVSYTELDDDVRESQGVSSWAVGGRLIPKVIFKIKRFSASAGIPVYFDGSTQKFNVGGMIGIGYDW